MASVGSLPGSPNPREIESKLKRWIQLYRPVLHVTVMQALQLQITPDRCTTDMLYVYLEPNLRSQKQADFQTEIAHAFRVQKTEIYSFAETREIVKEKGLMPDSLFQSALDQSRQIRNQGGVGLALVMISVPVAGIMHATPCGFIDSQEGISLNPEWESHFIRAIEEGRIF